MVFPGKGVYEGEFKNGCIEGTGTFTFKNGTVYYGEWKANMMEGKGTLTYTTKKEYIGDFKRGVRWGTGILKWPDGRKYDGGWKEDKQNGQGRFEFVTGVIKTGVWSRGTFIKWVDTSKDDVGGISMNASPDTTERKIMTQISGSAKRKSTGQEFEVTSLATKTKK